MSALAEVPVPKIAVLTMRAALFERRGPSRDVLEVRSVARPHAGPGEVVVEVACSGVNPSDVAQRSGAFLQSVGETYPIIPHSDGAGVVIATGQGVEQARLGERVWIWNGRWHRAQGTAAEYIAVPNDHAVVLPENISFEEGAAFGVPLLTAWRAVTIEGSILGKTILISGGAGAVSLFAIQLAKIGGARVIATVSNNEKREYALKAGADIVINYRSDDVADRVLALTDGVGADLAIDLEIAANAPMLARAVRPFGTIVVYGSHGPVAAFPAVDMIVKSLSVRFFIVYELQADVRRDAITYLTHLLALGLLKTIVAAVLPLDRIVEAHELVEQGRTIGNVVLKIR